MVSSLSEAPIRGKLQKTPSSFGGIQPLATGVGGFCNAIAILSTHKWASGQALGAVPLPVSGAVRVGRVDPPARLGGRPGERRRPVAGTRS